MTTVNTSASGTTYITGVIGTVDTGALITAAVAAKMVPYNALESQITTNTTKITAYQALSSQATQLQTYFAKLQSDILGNTFAGKTSSIASSGSTPASNLITATVTDAAQVGTSNIVVSQSAKPFAAESTDQTSFTTPLGVTGTFDLGQTGKTAYTVNIDPTSTLQSIRNDINAHSGTTGVSSDIVQVTPGVYHLVIRGTTTSDAVNVTNITGSNVLQSLGMTDSSGTFQHITQPAQPAIVTINGTQVTSTSNQINDITTGISLNINGADPSTTVTLTVSPDISTMTTDITNAVTGYNALMTTINDNQEVNSDGSIAANAVLYGDSLNSSLGSQLSGLISGTYGTGIFNGLASLGISLDDNNNLTIDSDALNTALTNNLNDVQSVFATNGSSVGLGDSVVNLLKSYTDPISGSLFNGTTLLQTQNNSLTQQADTIQSSVNDYQDQLIQTYANLQSQMQAAVNTKQQILAILNQNTQSN